MSVEAITWALAQRVDRSTAKFVLVAMANCANSDMPCWPSMQYLADATCQDRKTVLENIKRLKAAGFISDTDERKGRTGQVAVYILSGTENGTVKESQKRNRTEIGTVSKSPVFPVKESRFSAPTVPKTGHGTVMEPSMNQKKEKRPPVGARLSHDWLPSDADVDYANSKGVRVSVESENFRDYWLADTTAKARKADWAAAWRTWCRKAVQFTEEKRGGSETAYQRAERERMERDLPLIAAKRPGASRNPMEELHALVALDH